MGGATCRSQPVDDMNCASMVKALRSTPTCAPFKVRFGSKAKGSGQTAAIRYFLATAHVASQHQQQLGRLVRMIAVDRGEDSFELQLNQKIPRRRRRKICGA